MTNYEILMSEMTAEKLAELNVKLVIVDNTRLFYLTSSGQLFTIDKKEAAIRHEYQWLTYNPEPNKTQTE